MINFSVSSSDSIEQHEERMGLFYAFLEDKCPGGVDPLIWDEILSEDYKSEE